MNPADVQSWIRDAEKAFSQATDLDSLKTARLAHLGDKAPISLASRSLGSLAPDEKAFFHIDGNCGITCLFYVNSDYDVDDGGETQFILNNTGVNILPLPNRLSFFDATILHKATSFKNKHRFTIAVKYS